MDARIFNFSKPSPDSTVASNRIAQFISETLELPLHWDDSIVTTCPDVLIIVNGAFAFCKYLPELAVAVEFAKRIIWVQNDYTISPPKPDSNAESPFRAAFRNRAANGLPTVDYWTTVKKNASATDRSAYLNWNSLTYEPLCEEEILEIRKNSTADLFYYGAFREKRIKSFDKYFINSPVSVTISSTSDKFRTYSSTRQNPYAKSNGVIIEDGMKRSEFYRELARHGLGLYIEDDKSHTEFHSPANRFYEMLSAGLPMVFDPAAITMFMQAGIDIYPYISMRAGLADMMDHREDMGKRQRAEWHKLYRHILAEDLRFAFGEYVRRI